MTESGSEKSVPGSTGHRPVPPGDPPGGMAATLPINFDAGFPTNAPAFPIGESPTGTGGSPVLPISQTRSISSPSRRKFLQRSTMAAGALLLNFAAPGAEPSPRLNRRDAALSPQDKVILLFNGEDLTGLYAWLKDTKYDDPRKVFTVKDGLLRISGEVAGYLGTEKEYRDYHLIVEYKWGERTYGSKTVRNSGILLHAVGPDGNRSPWMSSIECQVAQGCVGDFIVIRGKDEDGATIPVTITSETVLGPDGRTRWKKGGQPTVYSGRQFWWSLHDPDFKELIDTRGKNDVESPLGEWTRVECLCDGNRITVIVNGTTINECFDVFPSAGRILLESEGFEILFRKFELHPLKK